MANLDLNFLVLIIIFLTKGNELIITFFNIFMLIQVYKY